MNGNGNGSKYVTWQMIAVIISLLGLMLLIGGVVNSKADRESLEACEMRMEKRVDGVEQRLERNIQDIKESQDKMYDLLLNKLR